MRANATGLPAPIPATAAAPAEAVTALYQAHALGLIRLAVVMLGDRPAAEDVVQEAFCGLYRRWHSLADTGKALAYVRSSVINGCRTVLRRRLRQRGVDPLTGDPPGESAEAVALIGEEHRQVLTAMRRLPSRQREVLVLRFYLDLDEEETAASMRISRGTVKSTTSRAGRARPDPGGTAVMNLIEDRIRAAARAAADTVEPDSVPPLELPTARPRRFGRRPRGAHSPGAAWTPWVARLTPVAAALAVIAIVITVVTVSHPPHQGPTLVTGAAARPDIPLGPPAGTYVRSGQVPPYFVTLTPSGAAVHLTVGGAAVATIRPSLPGGKAVAVTAAGDDRTFVLAEQGQERKAVTFYQFRLGSSGRPGGLTRLPMSVADEKTMTGLALSPDGTRLAIAVAPGGGVQQVRLYPVHGGPARTWSATGGTIGEHFTTWALSWPASQRRLAFNWSAGQTTSLRLLNLGTAGGSLLAASRPAVTLAKTAKTGQTLYQCPVMTITPDGSTTVCPSSTITNIARNGTRTYSTGFPEFSVTTGRLIRITGHWPRKQNDTFVYTMFWSGASGQVLIGMIHSAARDWVGVISGNRFTPLNVPSSLGTYAFGTW